MRKTTIGIAIIVAISIFSISSFADSVDDACKSLGNLGKVAAEARDSGISKDMAMGAMLSNSGNFPIEVRRLMALAIEVAYKTSASPEFTGQQISTVCTVEVRKLKSNS